MEERVPCRVASNSHHLQIKEIQVQLLILKERTGRGSNSLLALMQRWHCSVTEGQRFTTKTGAGFLW